MALLNRMWRKINTASYPCQRLRGLGQAVPSVRPGADEARDQTMNEALAEYTRGTGKA